MCSYLVHVATGYHTSTGTVLCHAHNQEHTMTIDQSKLPQTTIVPDSTQPARTDDLLASGADTADGARGFTDQADRKSVV